MLGKTLRKLRDWRGYADGIIPIRIMAKAEPETSTSIQIEGTATIEIEAAAKGADGSTSAEPPLARFKMTANTGSPMRLTGWKYPVVLDLEGVQIPRQNSPIRLGHDPMQGVGHTDSIAVVDGKLVAAGIISRSTAAAKDVRESAKNGFPWQASVGASADNVEFVKSGDKGAANGREYDGPVNIARKSTLGEISFVDAGADPLTDAMVATGKRIAAAQDDGEEDDGDLVASRPRDGEEAIEQSIRRKDKENLRQRGIQALVDEALEYRGANTGSILAIAKKAIGENWTVVQAELALMRANRGRVPEAMHVEPAKPKVMEAALCLGIGIKDEILAKDRDYGPDVVNQAWQYRNSGLHGIMAMALEASGVRPPHGARELYDAVLDNVQNGKIAAAGFSTVNLPGILGNVANKSLLDAFNMMDATYDLIANQADFSNFHVQSIYRLGVNGSFELVPPDGEIKSASLAQDSYSNKLDTYGKMLTLTRQQIINDDLNAFKDLTSQLGKRAKIAVEKALYTLVCEASDVFYTTAQGNRLVGALGITELAAARAAQYKMADSNGDPIYARSRFILVPPELEFFARQVWTSQLVNDFTTGKARPTDNPFQNTFQPVSSPFLSDSRILGSSASTWYMLADPVLVPAFQVGYLDGRRAPTIETREARFETLGLSMRAYWDFAVARLDFRGAVKSTAT